MKKKKKKQPVEIISVPQQLYKLTINVPLMREHLRHFTVEETLRSMVITIENIKNYDLFGQDTQEVIGFAGGSGKDTVC